MSEELGEDGVVSRRVPRVRYSHTDMIDFIIANPGISQGALAARYGYSQSWVSTVMSSDAWQSAMAARREELVDPALLATIEERFKALTHRSLDRLMQKLDAPQVSDQVVLQSVALGAKAMGLGGNAPPVQQGLPVDHLDRLAQRLLALQASVQAQHQRLADEATVVSVQ